MVKKTNSPLIRYMKLKSKGLQYGECNITSNCREQSPGSFFPGTAGFPGTVGSTAGSP